jgi:hypothetical protein
MNLIYEFAPLTDAFVSNSDVGSWPVASVALTQQIGSDPSNSRHAVNTAAA